MFAKAVAGNRCRTVPILGKARKGRESAAPMMSVLYAQGVSQWCKGVKVNVMKVMRKEALDDIRWRQVTLDLAWAFSFGERGGPHVACSRYI